jgi:hypothetical protein
MRSATLFASTITLPGFFRVAGALFSCCLAISGAALAGEYVVPLEHAKAVKGFFSIHLIESPRTAPFTNEPAAPAQGWRRGTLRLNKSDARPMAYLWSTDGTLRLDLNRNEDLSDDPAGVYKARDAFSHGAYSYSHSSFTNVLWIEDAKSAPLMVDLSLWENGGRRGASGRLKSYQSGKLEIDGKAWEVGVFQSLNRAGGETELFLLRPWEQRKDTIGAEAPYTDTFKAAKKVAFGGRTFDMAFSPGEIGGSGAGTVKLVEQPVAYGELTIAGHVERVVLEGQDTIAIVDAPGKTVKVPAGRYESYRVRLGSGANAAFRETSGRRDRAVVVEGSKTAVLAVGGPLTNSATVDKRGSQLSLNYKLLGLGGEPYEFRDDSRDTPPRYTIYEGDRKVASGNFEYG